MIVRLFEPPRYAIYSPRYSHALRFIASSVPGMKWEAAQSSWVGYPDAIEQVLKKLDAAGVRHDGELCVKKTAAKIKKSTLKGMRDYQKEAARFIVANAADGVLCADDMGLGKAQEIDEPVLTPTGWKPIGSLRVGDKVIGSSGLPTKVTGVFPQGRRQVFEVLFTDGGRARCCAEHLWAVQTPNDRVRGGALRVLSLDDIRAAGVVDKIGNRKWFIPIVGPVQFARGPKLPIDPYVLGALIANGSFGKQVVHHGSEDQWAQLRPLLPLGLELRRRGKFSVAIVPLLRAGVNKIREGIRALELEGKHAHEKFVPEIYKFASPEDRLALLQGLFDNDGTVSKDGMCVEYNTVSPALADAVVFLVRSLGGVTRSTSRVPHYTYKGKRLEGQVDYRIRIMLPAGVVPFRLPRKVMRHVPRTKYPPARAIVEIKPAGKKECVCIRVAAEDHLYVTRDFVVTHNTMTAIRAAKALRAPSIVVCPSFVRMVWRREVEKWRPKARIIELWGVKNVCPKCKGTGEPKKERDVCKSCAPHPHHATRCEYCGCDDRFVCTRCAGSGHRVDFPYKPSRTDIFLVHYDIVHGWVKELIEVAKAQPTTIIFDECFPAGTQVANRLGTKPIESIRPGDQVKCAVGFGRVQSVGCRAVSTASLRLVQLNDGREFICTAEHPILALRPLSEMPYWCAAGDLLPGAFILDVVHTRAVCDWDEQRRAHPQVPRTDEVEEAMQALFAGRSDEARSLLLLAILRREMAGSAAGAASASTQDSIEPSVSSEAVAWAQGSARAKARLGEGEQQSNAGTESDALSSDTRESGAQGPFPPFARVARVAVPEPADFTRLGLGGPNNQGRVQVYNLEVDTHPSYVVAGGVVVHNCHYLQSDRSRRSGACRDLASACTYRIGLSGTPMTSRPRDLWNPVETLSPGRFGKPFSFYLAHADAKQETISMRSGPKTVWKTDGASRLDELRERLSWFMIRRTKSEVELELPPCTRQIIELEVERKFRKLPSGSFGEKSKDKVMREALGFAADGKLNQVLEMVQSHLDQGHKVVVGCHRVNIAQALAASFAAEGIDAKWIAGPMPMHKREEIIDAEPDVLCCTMDSTKAGIDLTYANVGLIVELDWTPATLLQWEARFNRFGQKKNVLIQYLIALGTADELIRNAVIDKLSTFEAVVGKTDDKLHSDLAGQQKTADELLSNLATKLRRMYGIDNDGRESRRTTGVVDAEFKEKEDG
jgi:hypothetical protein